MRRFSAASVAMSCNDDDSALASCMARSRPGTQIRSPAATKPRGAPSTKRRATVSAPTSSTARAPAALAAPRPSLREAQKNLTRARILEAAARLFHERGYVETTVDDIVGAAGISRATFYLHHRSKAALMGTLLDGVLPAVHGLYRDLHALPSQREVDVIAWVERLLSFYEEHQEVIGASAQAEAVDLDYSRRIEALAWQLAGHLLGKPQLGSQASTSTQRKKDPLWVRAVMMVMELDRTATLCVVRGWTLDRHAVATATGKRWFTFLCERGPQRA
jgi:AcrR family transcriptional regulator